MRTDLTEIIFLLDRSGSMDVVREATIAAFNGFVSDQAKQPGEARMSLYQFDDKFEPNYVSLPIGQATELTAATFVPRGSTALVGAMGRVIKETGDRLASLPESDRPGKVVVVILTDGQENASRDYEWSRSYDHPGVFNAVTHQTDKHNWQFVFLGANQDAIATAAQLGVLQSSALNFNANPGSVDRATKKMSDGMSQYRAAPAMMSPGEYVVSAGGFFGGSQHADDDIQPNNPLAQSAIPMSDFTGTRPNDHSPTLAQSRLRAPGGWSEGVFHGNDGKTYTFEEMAKNPLDADGHRVSATGEW